MPKPISDGQVEYPKGPDGKSPVPETVDQYGRDLAAFLMWAAEPHMVERKAVGFRVIVFMLLFAALVYVTKRKVWASVH